jgi:hypothetical protein
MCYTWWPTAVTLIVTDFEQHCGGWHSQLIIFRAATSTNLFTEHQNFPADCHVKRIGEKEVDTKL